MNAGREPGFEAEDGPHRLPAAVGTSPDIRRTRNAPGRRAVAHMSLSRDMRRRRDTAASLCDRKQKSAFYQQSPVGPAPLRAETSHVSP